MMEVERKEGTKGRKRRRGKRYESKSKGMREGKLRKGGNGK